MIPQLVTNSGENISQLSSDKPVLLVFLRHFGCTFCREAMSDIEQQREAIEAQGVRIVMVHMKNYNYANQIFKIYGLEDIDHISDPEKKLYQFFGLERGSLKQLFGFQVWIKGFIAGIIKGHLIGTEQGDGFQMPGVFLIHKNKILKSFKHKYASDRPDYVEIAKSAVSV